MSGASPPAPLLIIYIKANEKTPNNHHLPANSLRRPGAVPPQYERGLTDKEDDDSPDGYRKPLR